MKRALRFIGKLTKSILFKLIKICGYILGCLYAFLKGILRFTLIALLGMLIGIFQITKG